MAELFANDGVTSISMVFMVTAYMLMIIWDIQQVMKSEKKLLKDRFKDWTIRRKHFHMKGQNAAISEQEVLRINYFFKIFTYSLDRDKHEINESFLLLL